MAIRTDKRAHWSKVKVAGRDASDFAEICTFSTRQIEALAAQQTKLDGFYCRENLELLREAWKVAKARENVTPVAAAAPVAAPTFNTAAPLKVAGHRACVECGYTHGHRADCCLF